LRTSSNDLVLERVMRHGWRGEMGWDSGKMHWRKTGWARIGKKDSAEGTEGIRAGRRRESIFGDSLEGMEGACKVQCSSPLRYFAWR
jgi:hypothetical protein